MSVRNTVYGVLALLGLALAARPAAAQNVLYGDTAAFAQGVIRTWVEMTNDSIPTSVGVTLTSGAVTSLPPDERSFSLNLPQGIPNFLIQHIYLNWNPNGHPPAQIYGVPHFDVHFYYVSAAERRAIQEGIDSIPVPPQFIPAGYDPGGPPYATADMGVHYVDLQAPEFHGQPFTRTLIYGYYHGLFYFQEPMIALSYLQTHPDTTIAIRQPAAFQREGYYPTTYTVAYDSAQDSYTISLGGFVLQAAVAVDPVRDDAAPTAFALLGNYPNPFNPGTTIAFDLPQRAQVSLRVYNVLGEEVAMLVNDVLPAGRQRIYFDGSRLASGVYLYRLETPGLVQMKRMVLLK